MNREEVRELSSDVPISSELRELADYGELLLTLVWKDFSVRYRQSVLGVAWAVFRPLFNLFLMVFIFSIVAPGGNSVVYYPIVVLAALVPWQVFSAALGEMSNSLVGNLHIIGKVYFPRLLMPLSSFVLCLVDGMITLLLLAALLLLHPETLSWNALFLPLLLLWAAVVAWGAGLFFAAINVRFRDVRFITPVLLQVLLYVSPVGYEISRVPAWLLKFYYLNPLVPLIEAFRWAAFQQRFEVPGYALVSHFIFVVGSAMIGYAVFRSVDRIMADIG